MAVSTDKLIPGILPPRMSEKESILCIFWMHLILQLCQTRHWMLLPPGILM